VGAPSNVERLATLVAAPGKVDVSVIGDRGIRARIVAEYQASGYVWCPHSATAAEAYARLRPGIREECAWLLCATAHPYKFAEIVAPLIGRPIEPPPALAAIMDRQARALPIPATAAALAAVLDDAPIPPCARSRRGGRCARGCTGGLCASRLGGRPRLSCRRLSASGGCH